MSAPTRPAPLLLLVLLAALAPLSMDAVLPSLPALGQALHVGARDAQQVITAFMVGFSIGQIVWGPLADRFGRRPVLLACLVAFATCNVGIVLSSSLQAILLWRALAGVTACAGMVLSRTLVVDTTAPNDRPRVIGALASAMFLAPALGPVLGGLLQASAGWRAIFGLLAALPVAVVAYIVWRFQETLTEPDPSALRISTIASTWWQLLRNPYFLRPSLVVAAMSGSMFAFITASPVVMMKELGLSSSHFGIAYMIIAATFIVGAQIGRRAEVGHAKPWVVAALVVAVAAGGSIVVVAGAPFDSSDRMVALVWFVASAAVFYGTLGVAMPISMAAGLRDCEAIGGRASALQGFLQAAGGVAASAAIGFVPDAALGIGVFIVAGAGISLVVLAFAAPWRDLPDVLRSFVRVVD